MHIALMYRAQIIDTRGGALLAQRARSISGFRLVTGAWLYEVLEGEFLTVSRAFAEVLEDPALGAVEMLSNAPITHRACAGWSAVAAGETQALPAAVEAKVQMLHQMAARLGGAQPVLRDLLAHIGTALVPPVASGPALAAVA